VHLIKFGIFHDWNFLWTLQLSYSRVDARLSVSLLASFVLHKSPKITLAHDDLAICSYFISQAYVME